MSALTIARNLSYGMGLNLAQSEDALAIDKILGPLFHSRWRMSDAGLVQIGGPVSDVPNDALAISTTHLTSSGTSRPAHSATGLDGSHAVATGDGSNDHLIATLSPAIASGARPYLFMVGRLTAVSAAAKYLLALWQNQSPTEDGSGQLLSLLIGGTGRWASDWRSSSALVQTLGGDADTDVHVFEIGMTAGGTASLVVDRIGRNSTQTATINTTLVGLQSHGLVLSGDDFFNSPLAEAELIVCSDEPTLAQKQLVSGTLKSLYAIPNYPIAGVTRFDLSQVDAAIHDYSDDSGQNFIDAVSDGRYIYFPPGPSHNKLLRFDTQGDFNSADSRITFNLSTIAGFTTGWYQGGCFDGRYVYFAPYGAGMFLRYDTQASFTDAASYTLKDLTAVDALGFGFVGAIYDGARYVHLVPDNNAGPAHGLAFRYDTQASFTANGSYATFDCTSKDADCKGFAFGVAAGGYIYFGPWDTVTAIVGKIIRYNTALPYTSGASWEVFDATTVNANAKGYVGVTYDGSRYIYFTPFNKTRGSGDNGTALRYDTQGSFTSVDSYIAFDMTSIWPRAQGHMQAVWDGSRYLYYTPQETGGGTFGLVIRYDSQGAGFDQSSSYKPIALEQIGDGKAAGYAGGIAVGGNVYLSPCQSKYAIRIIA